MTVPSMNDAPVRAKEGELGGRCTGRRRSEANPRVNVSGYDVVPRPETDETITREEYRRRLAGEDSP